MKTDWKFNEDYHDYKQVEQFYPAFDKLHKSITDKGNFAYNSLFEGTLGIENEKEEKTAIYLLQQSKTEKTRQAKIEELLSSGFKQIEKIDKVTRFEKIIQVGTDHSRATIKEFEDCKIFSEEGGNLFILPKRCSRRGYRIYSDRLIFAK